MPSNTWWCCWYASAYCSPYRPGCTPKTPSTVKSPHCREQLQLARRAARGPEVEDAFAAVGVTDRGTLVEDSGSGIERLAIFEEADHERGGERSHREQAWPGGATPRSGRTPRARRGPRGARNRPGTGRWRRRTRRRTRGHARRAPGTPPATPPPPRPRMPSARTPESGRLRPHRTRAAPTRAHGAPARTRRRAPAFPARAPMPRPGTRPPAPVPFVNAMTRPVSGAQYAFPSCLAIARTVRVPCRHARQSCRAVTTQAPHGSRGGPYGCLPAGRVRRHE